MKIGINVMSTIGSMKDDFTGTVDRLYRGGCSFLELMSDWGARQETIDFYASLTGGKSGWDPENTLERLDYIHSIGMDVKGMFVFDEVLEEQAEELGKYCSQTGISYIVLSYLEYGDINDIYDKIEKLRRIAKILKPYGVQIVQHNHEHDVVLVTDRDGKEKPIIDVFLEQLTPEELMLEVDTGWVQYAGLDPAAYIKEKINRVMILHFKDICKDYQSVSREEIFVPCGEGAVDFQAVLDAVPAEKKETMLYVIDQDASKGDIVKDLIKAMEYLNQLKL